MLTYTFWFCSSSLRNKTKNFPFYSTMFLLHPSSFVLNSFKGCFFSSSLISMLCFFFLADSTSFSSSAFLTSSHVLWYRRITIIRNLTFSVGIYCNLATDRDFYFRGWLESFREKFSTTLTFSPSSNVMFFHKFSSRCNVEIDVIICYWLIFWVLMLSDGGFEKLFPKWAKCTKVKVEKSKENK